MKSRPLILLRVELVRKIRGRYITTSNCWRVYVNSCTDDGITVSSLKVFFHFTTHIGLNMFVMPCINNDYGQAARSFCKNVHCISLCKQEERLTLWAFTAIQSVDLTSPGVTSMCFHFLTVICKIIGITPTRTVAVFCNH